MSVRAFALALIGIVAALWAATMAINVIVDPEAVFDPGRAGERVNSNSRYIRYVQYRSRGSSAEGVLFASSRGNSFETDELARKLGVSTVANFSVTYGMVSDHLPTLEFLIRDQAARGATLKSVLLMVDIDHFGKVPWTNVNLDGFLPPEVSGEHPARFWWRYLTAFQFRVWSATVRQVPGRRAEAPLGAPIVQAAMLPPLRFPQSLFERVAARATPERRYDIIQRPQLDGHLSLLARMAALCREHGVKLTVLTSPLNRANARGYDPAELARITERIGGVVPLWDFGTPDWLSDRSDLWFDSSHFKPEVARMMLDRIFGPAQSAPAGFGTLRGG
jgi:hypothetical protein